MLSMIYFVPKVTRKYDLLSKGRNSWLNEKISGCVDQTPMEFIGSKSLPEFEDVEKAHYCLSCSGNIFLHPAYQKVISYRWHWTMISIIRFGNAD